MLNEETGRGVLKIFGTLRLNKVCLAPAVVMKRIWFFTAAGMWLTAFMAWIITLVTSTGKEPDIFPVILGGVVISAVSGWVYFRQEHTNTAKLIIAYGLIVFFAAYALSALCEVTSIAIVFGITGAMFFFSALVCHYCNTNPGGGWAILMMAIGGMTLAIIINGLMVSDSLVWKASFLAVFIWSFTSFNEAAMFKEFSRKLYAADYTTVSCCALLGGMTLYFSAAALLFQLVMFIISIIRWLIFWWI